MPIPIAQLMPLQKKPALFTPGEPLFWDDPHISSQMLKVHLDAGTDAASRKPKTIDRSVDWIIHTLGLTPGASLLDLGCGPGLYASRFAEAGFRITGVDYSHRSIAYAKMYASERHLDITYRYQNYLDLTDESLYDAAFLIFGDFCPLNPEQRSKLLVNIHRALKPGGHFVLDVSTREHRRKHGVKNNWHSAESGFWKPGPHLVLEQGFDYPDESVWLDQYIVIEADERVTVYRNWFQDYTPEAIRAELTRGGFAVQSLWGDLAGATLVPDSEWIGVVAQKL